MMWDCYRDNEEIIQAIFKVLRIFYPLIQRPLILHLDSDFARLAHRALREQVVCDMLERVWEATNMDIPRIIPPQSQSKSASSLPRFIPQQNANKPSNNLFKRFSFSSRSKSTENASKDVAGRPPRPPATTNAPGGGKKTADRLQVTNKLSEQGVQRRHWFYKGSYSLGEKKGFV